MTLSLFLAKFLGIYFLVFSLIWICRPKEFQTALREALNSHSVLALQGMLTLLGGIAIVVSHQVWQLDWRGLVTLLGWVLVAKGIIRIGFPKYEKKMGLCVLDHGFWSIPIMIIIGLYLTISGFMC